MKGLCGWRGRARVRRFVAVVGVLAAAGVVGLAPQAAQAGPGGRSDPAGGAALVRTDAGWVRGQVTGEGRQFLGIPYARQPVGGLRWTEPRAVEPWRGVREATAFGNRCVQGTSWDPGYEKPTYTEACLDLNVYVPGG
ncbi:carboxylesterase family protein, partial [Streptomyces lasiicapitis]|uniref:carboxylesterase family protein n=1 Tax=Streptomyces lasiicapitis TaxID=1923961 RepID=UPI003680D131